MIFWAQEGPNLRSYLRYLFRREGRQRLSRFLRWEAPLPRRAFSSGGMSSMFEVSPRPPPRRFLRRPGGISSSFMSSEFPETSGLPKWRSAVRKVDQLLRRSVDPPEDYRGKQGEIRPSPETKTLYNLGICRTASQRALWFISVKHPETLKQLRIFPPFLIF